MDREYHQKVAKKFESSLVFPDQINRLWRLLKDKSKLLYICCSINLIYFLESGKTGFVSRPDFFLKSRFFLLITKENNIFLSYHHDFKSPIEQSELNNKKKFLNDIKRLFEK